MLSYHDIRIFAIKIRMKCKKGIDKCDKLNYYTISRMICDKRKGGLHKLANMKMIRGKMVEKGLNAEELSVIINKDRATFYRKLNSDGDNFTIKEANLIVNALKLTPDEATAIFFA